MTYSVPGYLTPFLMAGMIAIVAVVLYGVRQALHRTAWAERDQSKAFWSVSLLLVGWFLLAVVSSVARWYQPASGSAPTIQYGLFIPIIAGVVLFRTVPLLRRTLSVIPNSWLVGVQLYRALGVIFLLLYAGRHLPGLFALPAGIGDVSVGILAPFVAGRVTRSSEDSERGGRLWNYLGIADLVIAVTLGFLTAPSPLQMAAFDRPSGLIGMFPLSLIPVFAVPLSILFHFASLQSLSQHRVVGRREHKMRIPSSDEAKA